MGMSVVLERLTCDFSLGQIARGIRVYVWHQVVRRWR